MAKTWLAFTSHATPSRTMLIQNSKFKASLLTFTFPFQPLSLASLLTVDYPAMSYIHNWVKPFDARLHLISSMPRSSLKTGLTICHKLTSTPKCNPNVKQNTHESPKIWVISQVISTTFKTDIHSILSFSLL